MVTRMRSSAKIHVSFVLAEQLKLVAIWCSCVLAMSGSKSRRPVQLYGRERQLTRSSNYFLLLFRLTRPLALD
uniref:Predicted protein n=1 Tax=Hordeum vulgare subsp. vulgare TaxID=112509 RepID=F2EAZ6_HORVV|nr:predicted protein [Hordeum vulgare subsp. vulgare]